MKKLLRFFVIVSFALNFLIGNKVQAQCSASVTENITFGPFTCECCNGYSNPAYFCFNDPGTAIPTGDCSGVGGVCGSGAASASLTFSNPVPAGNIVTQVQLTYHAAPCGGTITTVLNGVTIVTDALSSGACSCGNNIFAALVGTSTANYPCGLPSYNNTAGATETIVFNFPGGVATCMSAVDIVFCYAPANQAVPATQPASISGPTSVCPGTTNNYSASSPNAASYIWSVPAGWTINGSATGSTINVTAGASGGNICVKAVNACGTSAQTCLAVSILPSSTTPNVPTANPNPICPGNPTTLSVSGGTLGGGNYTWYAGSCNSGVIGTGASISVSPAVATTYFVNITGGCNTTACTNVLVNVNGVQPTPSNPSGTASVCSGSTQVYTTTGSGGYNWTVPAGTTINSGQSTTSINVTIGSTGGNICVTSTGACGTSPAACTPITITSTPATPGAITGTTPVCPGSDNYSIAPVGGATSYLWSVSGGGSVTAGGTSTTATINWTTPGAWIVNCSAVNSCGNSTAATFPVTVNPNPTINITPSTTAICTGSTVATLTATGGNTYTWTPPGIVAPLNGAVVTAAPTNTTAPTVITVTGTDGNGCTNTANVSIMANATPTVSVAGGGSNFQTVCSGSAVAPINFNITPAGTVTWTSTNAAAIGLVPGSGITNPIPGYTAPVVATQQTGVITVNAMSAAGCTSSSSTDLTYTITINPLPGATAPSYTPASCGVPNGVAMINGTGGSGTYQYSWNSGAYSATNTYTNAAGTYPVSIQDMVSNCIFTTNVTIPNAGAPPPPAITATTMSVCVGGSVTLFATPPIAGMTYSWTESDGNTGTGSTYTVNNIPSGPNPYLITVTSTSLGCTGTAGTISITVNPIPPTPTFSLPTTANDTSCQGSPPTLTVNSGTSTAVWYSNNIWLHAGSSYTPPAGLPPGTYTFSVIDSVAIPNGCVNAVQSANTVTLSLVVNASPPAPTTTSNTLTTECQGLTPAITLSVTPAAGSTPVWYNATTGGVVAVATNTYTPPNGTAGTTTYIVIDSSIVNPNTCTSAAAGHVLTFSVVINPSPGLPVFTAPTTANDTSCQGSPTALTVNTGTIVPAPLAVWYSNNIWVHQGSSYTPPVGLAPGTYTFSIIDSLNIPNGCISAPQSANTVTLSLLVNPSPTAPSSSSGTVVNECQNQVPPTTLSVTPTGTVTSVPVWYNGATYVTTGDTYTPPNGTPGNTMYTIIDSSIVLHNTCTSLATGSVLNIDVQVNPTPTQPVLTAPTGPNDTTCQGSPSALTVSSGTNMAVWYSNNIWLHAGSNYTPPAGLPAGTYTFSVIDSVAVPNGCVNAPQSANTVTLTLVVEPTPTVNVGSAVIDSANCGKMGGVTGLSTSNVSGGTPPYHYQWFTGGSAISNDTSINLTNVPTTGVSGTYSLQVTDAHGCHAITPLGTSSSFTVPSVSAPAISFSTTPNPATGVIPLAVTFTNQTTGANSFVWTFGDGTGSNAVSPIYTYTAVGTYTATLVAINKSCRDTATVIIITDVPTTIIIPNIFSPNGDNINDQFFIVNTGMSSLNCSIFNRWGQLLYTITAPGQSWDGKTPNGDNAPDGTYLYILQAQGLDGKTYKQNGTVTLVR